MRFLQVSSFSLCPISGRLGGSQRKMLEAIKTRGFSSVKGKGHSSATLFDSKMGDTDG